MIILTIVFVIVSVIPTHLLSRSSSPFHPVPTFVITKMLNFPVNQIQAHSDDIILDNYQYLNHFSVEGHTWLWLVFANLVKKKPKTFRLEIYQETPINYSVISNCVFTFSTLTRLKSAFWLDATSCNCNQYRYLVDPNFYLNPPRVKRWGLGRYPWLVEMQLYLCFSCYNFSTL